MGKQRTQIPLYAEGAEDLQASEKIHPTHNPVILRARALGAPRTTQVVHGVSGAKDLLWKATNPSIVIANIYCWPSSHAANALYQGTTSVVPQAKQTHVGFSP